MPDAPAAAAAPARRASRQVLDARDPLACRCTDVERYIRQTNPSKKIVLLLNKMGEQRPQGPAPFARPDSGSETEALSHGRNAGLCPSAAGLG